MRISLLACVDQHYESLHDCSLCNKEIIIDLIVVPIHLCKKKKKSPRDEATNADSESVS